MARDVNYAAEFRLSMTLALRQQLLAALNTLAWARLDEESIAQLQSRGGVYQLALVDDDYLQPVYVGKSLRNLPVRLSQHWRKLSGRTPGLVESAYFRCAYVDEDLDSVAPEKMLMAELGSSQEAAWNTMGFGNKDPGKNRDRSLVKRGHFDRLYGINLDLPIEIHGEVIESLGQFMNLLKAVLPYNFRFEKLPATVYRTVVGLTCGRHVLVAGEWFEILAGLLPANWRVIALPGYVIAYPDIDEHDFGSRLGSWARLKDRVTFTAHDPQFESGEVSEDVAEADEN